MKKRNYMKDASLLMAVVLTAVIVASGMYVWHIKNPNVLFIPTQKKTTEQMEKPETPDPSTEESTIETGYDVESPEWTAVAEDVKSQTDELVESFYLPQSPSDESVIYLATSKDVTLDTSTNKIYSYNMETKELTQLYEEQDARLLRTLGRDGNKLIVMYDGIDNSPGPCFSLWLNAPGYGYLDLENPGELQEYTVPEYQVQKATEEQQQCEADIAA